NGNGLLVEAGVDYTGQRDRLTPLTTGITFAIVNIPSVIVVVDEQRVTVFGKRKVGVVVGRIDHRANVSGAFPCVAHSLGYEDVFIGFVILKHVFVEVVLPAPGGKDELGLVSVQNGCVVFIFRVYFPADIDDGVVAGVGDKLHSVLTFVDRPLYYCQVNLVAPLIVGFSGKSFLVHVVVLDRFVEVEPHLIAPADPVLDIESVVRILPEDTQEILYGKVFSNGPHMQFTRLEVCPEESRVQVGGPNHNFTYVVISH